MALTCAAVPHFGPDSRWARVLGLCLCLLSLAPSLAAQEGLQVILGAPPLLPAQPGGGGGWGSFRPRRQLAAALPFVKISSRAASRALFRAQYNVSGPAHPSWTGKVSPCIAGNTSANHKAATLRRINYFRAMAGIPNVTLSASLSTKAQAAALIMEASNKLSHTPSTSFKCYTAVGAEAAGSSILASGPGAFGRGAMDMYMNDFGVPSVGHRFWLLCPYTRKMGLGDTSYLFDPWQTDGCCKQPANVCTSTIPCSKDSTWFGGNALWVFPAPSEYFTRPATREPYVAWPPPGYVPWQFIYNQWTITYPFADFSTATVSMTMGGKALGVASKADGGWYGDNAFIWTLKGNYTATNGLLLKQPPSQDVAIGVVIKNVNVLGQPAPLVIKYTVWAFNPAK